MARKYYTLAVRNPDGAWHPEFGAYDRDDVDFEFDDYADRGEAKKKDMCIITTAGSSQALVNAALDKKNKDWRKG